ncbi:MAG: pirin family protein [Saprospiraceae bacterium]|nr:pirin family protein [Saprospiraceae bacterium]
MEKKRIIKDSAIVGARLAKTQIVQESGMYAKGDERTIYQVLDSDRTKVGTLPILRAFAGDHVDHVSPYVLFDEFGPVEVEAGAAPLRVDAHPHAGVTPTTYFIAGSGHHKDSLDYDFQIGKGDFMMFSSGRGAIHMEESGQQLQQHGGAYHGFQIWLNTPSAYKFAPPETIVFGEEKMSELETADFSAKVILGQLGDAAAKVSLHSPAFYYHIKLKPGGRIDLDTDPTHNAFAYLVNGQMEAQGNRKIVENQIVLFERGASKVRFFSQEGAEFLMLGGEPLDEVVYSYGPFVMNTEEQIRQCILNYRLGKMGDPALVN